MTGNPHRAQASLLDRARSAAANLLSAPTVLPEVCTTIAERDLALIDELLTRLERLEATERDPDALATLYGLDHLATRLRRNAETLHVLAGNETADDTGDNAIPLLDVIRAAMSGIERYQQVSIGHLTGLAVAGPAANDVSRLLAELLDNATAHSTAVVSAHLTESGSVLIRVEDNGTELSEPELAALNEHLSTDRQTAGGIGLTVTKRLAKRHGIDVRLTSRTPHGTTATALLPAILVREAVPDDQLVRTTTASGLPRRIRRKHPTPPTAEPAATEFMTDLAAFTEGELAARTEGPEGDDVGGA